MRASGMAVWFVVDRWAMSDPLADEQRGIVLLTGTTGSGKSTTLAAMVDHMNTERARHIITLEDPIEYLHRDERSIINQREVGQDTESFGRAMRRVLRQDPDVILVGEMRDLETIRLAMTAAKTGHLVFGTMHTSSPAETIDQILDAKAAADIPDAPAQVVVVHERHDAASSTAVWSGSGRGRCGP